PEQLSAVREAIEAAGITVDSAELSLIPKTTVAVEDETKARQVMRLIDADEAVGQRVLPYREARARRAPRLHRLRVAARSLGDPREQLVGQRGHRSAGRRPDTLGEAGVPVAQALERHSVDRDRANVGLRPDAR